MRSDGLLSRGQGFLLISETDDCIACGKFGNKDIINAVFRIHDILVRMDPAQDPSLFVSDLQDTNRNQFFSYCFLLVTF
jgi:hypothetical protein